jgi:striatin 1/3/4
MNGGSHASFTEEMGQQNKDGQNGGFTMAGILFWIQEEWNKIEMQKIQWDLEKAEFQAQIASLLGERRGQENIKLDLIRRIKMLEYALREERKITEQLKAKLHKKETNETTNKLTNESENSTSNDDHSSDTNNTPSVVKNPPDVHQRVQKDVESSQRASAQWKESIQRLKQYLMEIGYNENILDLRHLRLRQLMDASKNDGKQESADDIDGNLSERLPGHNQLVANFLDAEDAAIKTFDFLKDEALNENDGGDVSKSQSTDKKDIFEQLSAEFGSKKFTRSASKKASIKEVMASLQASDDSADSNPMRQTTFGQLSSDYIGSAFLGKSANDAMALGDLANVSIANEAEGNNNSDVMPLLGFGSNAKSQESSGLNEDDVFVGVNNDAKYHQKSGISSSDERRQWHIRHTLRGHWDCVRTISFHWLPEPQLISGGDDGCVIMWNSDPSANAMRSWSEEVTSTGESDGGGSMLFSDSQVGRGPIDLSPISINRGHEGPVLSSVIVPCEGNAIACTGGLDGTFRLWTVPPAAWMPSILRDAADDDGSNNSLSNADVDDNVTSSVNVFTSRDHNDAVWCIAHDNTSHPLLLSGSADGTVKLWNITVANQYENSDQHFSNSLSYSLNCRQTFSLGEQWKLSDKDVPSSLSLYANSSRMFIGTKMGHLLIVDVETGQLIFNQTASTDENNQVYSVAVHGTMPLALAGLENGLLCYVDTQTESVIYTTVAHQQTVTSLAFEPQGLYFATASADESIRLWDVATRSCVQEMHAHRTKYQESALAVTFHQSLPLMASAGADSIVNVFSAVSVPRN